MFEDVERILVIKLRHIGDVLLSVPAIRAVRERFPYAHITALVNKGTEEMLSGNGILDAVITFDRGIKALTLARRAVREIGFVRLLRKRRFDMAIDLTSGDRSALFSYLGGARYRIGNDPHGKGFAGKSRVYTHLGRQLSGNIHMVLQNLEVVKQFGMDTSDLTVDIFFGERELTDIQELIEKETGGHGIFIHMHPLSRWFFKCWDDEKIARVIDYCENEAGIRIVLTSSRDQREVKRINRILSFTHSSPVNLSGRLTLKELAALSSLAALFVGVDSAPMHIAAAVGTPVLALFGPSGAFEWGPWDNETRFVADDDDNASDSSVSAGGKDATGKRGGYEITRFSPYPLKNGVQVFGKNIVIQKGWSCVPCGRDGCGGSKRSDCLDGMDPCEVIPTIASIIEKASFSGRVVN